MIKNFNQQEEPPPLYCQDFRGKEIYEMNKLPIGRQYKFVDKTILALDKQ